MAIQRCHDTIIALLQLGKYLVHTSHSHTTDASHNNNDRRQSVRGSTAHLSAVPGYCQGHQCFGIAEVQTGHADVVQLHVLQQYKIPSRKRVKSNSRRCRRFRIHTQARTCVVLSSKVTGPKWLSSPSYIGLTRTQQHAAPGHGQRERDRVRDRVRDRDREIQNSSIYGYFGCAHSRACLVCAIARYEGAGECRYVAFCMCAVFVRMSGRGASHVHSRFVPRGRNGHSTLTRPHLLSSPDSYRAACSVLHPLSTLAATGSEPRTIKSA